MALSDARFFEFHTNASPLQGLDEDLQMWESLPPVVDDVARDFCRQLEAEEPCLLPVAPAKGSRIGWCSRNVADVVEKAGGRAVNGWLLLSAPGLWWNAEFHCVWERPDGKLLDVTPRRDGETDVLFAVSPAHPADFDFLERPNNLRLRAFGYDRHKQSAAWEIAGFNDRRIALEMVKARQKGLTLTQSVMSTLPRNSLEKKIDMFLADAGEMEAMLKPTPEGLVCRDMGRLDEFQNRRLDVDRQRRELYVIADVLLENAMRNGYRPG